MLLVCGDLKRGICEVLCIINIIKSRGHWKYYQILFGIVGGCTKAVKLFEARAQPASPPPQRTPRWSSDDARFSPVEWKPSLCPAAYILWHFLVKLQTLLVHSLLLISERNEEEVNSSWSPANELSPICLQILRRPVGLTEAIFRDELPSSARERKSFRLIRVIWHWSLHFIRTSLQAMSQ